MTPEYGPPEYYESKFYFGTDEANIKWDYYAFGRICYRLASGGRQIGCEDQIDHSSWRRSIDAWYPDRLQSLQPLYQLAEGALKEKVSERCLSLSTVIQ